VNKNECDGYEWRGDVPWKCRLPPGHKTAEGIFLGRSCRGTKTIVIDARQPDATTCPGCRVAVNIGEFCKCPMRWKG
jgi:hypothetical protein